MVKLIKTWWNKNWTNGSWVKMSVIGIMLTFVMAGVFYMKVFGTFERIANWFRNLIHRNDYYEQKGAE